MQRLLPYSQLDCQASRKAKAVRGSPCGPWHAAIFIATMSASANSYHA